MQELTDKITVITVIMDRISTYDKCTQMNISCLEIVNKSPA